MAPGKFTESQAAWRCHTRMLTFFSNAKNQGHTIQRAESSRRAKEGAASFGAWVILGTPHCRVQMLKSDLSSEKPEKLMD